MTRVGDLLSPSEVHVVRRRDDLTFSMDEYDRRLRELRERMALRHIEITIITDPENLAYLTGYQTTGYSYFQALVVPIDGESFMITRLLEESNVHARTWVEKTRPYSDTGDAIDTLWHTLREIDAERRVIGYERNSYFFPAYQQERMRATIRADRFVDCFGIVEEGRIVKSDEEIEVMRKAARATEAGVRAGIACVAEGVTENEIAAEVLAAMVRAGSDYPAVVPYITSGPRCTIGHATWEGRVVGRDETVFLEVGGCYRRYHTAMMRTVYLGEPSRALRDAEQLVVEAVSVMCERMRPGTTAASVDRAAREVLRRHSGAGALVTRSGYSIGIAFAPSWDEGYMLSLKPGEHTVLRENMTFHIIPWLFGLDGDKVMGISETVRVTPSGAERLMDIEQQLFVSP